MTNELTQAMDAQKKAEEALEQARKTVRDTALAMYQEAVKACETAGVSVAGRKPRRGRQWTPEQREAHAAACKARWDSLSPERRAARLAAQANGRWAARH